MKTRRLARDRDDISRHLALSRDMNARKVALECLLTLTHTRASIASVVDSAFGRYAISKRERRLANGIVYGVIRWQRQLDWVLDQFINPRFQLDARHRTILRIGAFQLLHLDAIPARAAIYETVQLTTSHRRKSARGQKTAGFINAILRSVQRKGRTLAYPPLYENPIEHIAISLSYPTWLVKRWLQTRGVTWTLAFCRASNQIAPLAVRVNSPLTQREEVRQSLRAGGITARLSKIAPDGLVLENPTVATASDTTNDHTLKDVLRREDIYVQDESAMLVPYLLAPKETQFIVDLCAAPGGKTTHLAHLMENRGKLVAVDVSMEKIALLQKNCRRIGANNVETRMIDATKADIGFIKTADAVLIDAPCSGFGTLRRHPDIKWNKTFEQTRALSQLQYNLLENAGQHIKPGGTLVYSTCSIEPMENEAVVQRFLANFPTYIVEDARRFLPDIPSSALTTEGFVQTLPHEHGVDGTFAARLRRVS